MNNICVIGNGSFATALVKVLTDNGNTINWWMRSKDAIEHIQAHNHNPHYLSSVYFNPSQLNLYQNINEAIINSTIVVFAVPSAFVTDVILQIDNSLFKTKTIVSAIKGILPNENLLLNEYLQKYSDLNSENYICITGPCHAEEIADEKLSYLTFSSINETNAQSVASCFETSYLRTVISKDVYGVQYAGILKNIYALGAGIAHGLNYGDNFLSVYITNTFAEMKNFMRDIALYNENLNSPHHYITSAYLGDLLVTCYSLHSRNRRFGNMLGKGFTVQNAKLELNMIAEGYYASKCIHEINENVKSQMPIANHLHNILWNNVNSKIEFKKIEKLLH